MGRRGGVLLDLFLIAFILAALAAAAAIGFWLWRGGRAPALWKAAVARFTGTAARPRASEPDVDVSERAVWIQARARDLLARAGVTDKHVVASFNAERQENGVRWLEDTLEVRRPAGFRERWFLQELGALLAERRLAVMAEKREPGRWTLDLGDRKRVYERLIFDGAEAHD